MPSSELEAARRNQGVLKPLPKTNSPLKDGSVAEGSRSKSENGIEFSDSTQFARRRDRTRDQARLQDAFFNRLLTQRESRTASMFEFHHSSTDRSLRHAVRDMAMSDGACGRHGIPRASAGVLRHQPTLPKLATRAFGRAIQIRRLV